MGKFATEYTKRTGMPMIQKAWDPNTGIPALDGKVAVVTGGNTGLGYITVRELAKHGAKVYMACRSEERATEAIKKMIEELPAAKDKVVYLQFDLTDLKSGDEACKTILAKEERLDIFIANAAVMAWPYKIVNGIEVQFWNHLGHYAFIQKLLPLLTKTSTLPDAHVRIVNVSSVGHQWMKPNPDFTSIETVNQEFKDTWSRYGQSKLANVLYTRTLQKHLGDEKIRCLTLHPGNVATELIRGPIESFGLMGKVMAWAAPKLAMTPFDGAKTQLWAATSPDVDEQDLKGAYIIPIMTVTDPSPLAQNDELAEQLWRFSEHAVKTLSDGSSQPV